MKTLKSLSLLATIFFAFLAESSFDTLPESLNNLKPHVQAIHNTMFSTQSQVFSYMTQSLPIPTKDSDASLASPPDQAAAAASPEPTKTSSAPSSNSKPKSSKTSQKSPHEDWETTNFALATLLLENNDGTISEEAIPCDSQNTPLSYVFDSRFQQTRCSIPDIGECEQHWGKYFDGNPNILEGLPALQSAYKNTLEENVAALKAVQEEEDIATIPAKIRTLEKNIQTCFSYSSKQLAKEWHAEQRIIFTLDQMLQNRTIKLDQAQTVVLCLHTKFSPCIPLHAASPKCNCFGLLQSWAQKVGIKSNVFTTVSWETEYSGHDQMQSNHEFFIEQFTQPPTVGSQMADNILEKRKREWLSSDQINHLYWGKPLCSFDTILQEQLKAIPGYANIILGYSYHNDVRIFSIVFKHGETLKKETLLGGESKIFLKTPSGLSASIQDINGIPFKATDSDWILTIKVLRALAINDSDTLSGEGTE